MTLEHGFAVVALAFSACGLSGSSSKDGGTTNLGKVTVSCEQNRSPAVGTKVCTDYKDFIEAALAPTETLCTLHGAGTWTKASCDRTGAVGACRLKGTNTDGSANVSTAWYFPGEQVSELRDLPCSTEVDTTELLNANGEVVDMNTSDNVAASCDFVKTDTAQSKLYTCDDFTGTWVRSARDQEKTARCVSSSSSTQSTVATWSEEACNHTGKIGGCRMKSSRGVGTYVVTWYGSPYTVGTAQPDCTGAGGTWLSP